jgi:hypothetical protein
MSVRDRRLPVTEIKLLLRLTGLLHGGLQLAFEVLLCDLPSHRSDQLKIARVPSGRDIAENVPPSRIDAERRNANCTFSQRREEIFRECIRLRNLRHQQWIVGTMVDMQNIMDEAGIVAVDIGSDRVD